MPHTRTAPDRSRLAGRLTLAMLLLAALVASWKRVGAGGSDAPSLVLPAPSRPAAEAAPAPPGTPAGVAAPPEPERIRIRRSLRELDPETRDALEARLAREYAAEQRFEQGLGASQMRARDVDARVRDAFQRVELEPELLDGGLMQGLRIRTVEGGSALSEAGFRAGDLLVSLDGRTLDDPAELPEILGRMGPQLSVCARRGGSEFCREISLR